jgi:hypothetical protein
MADYLPFGIPGDIEDRRGDGRTSPDMTPEWKNVPGSLDAIAVALGNYLWGTRAIPEASDTPLSDALGKRDIRLDPQVASRSPLDQAIDAASDQVSMFMPAGKKLGTDVPFTQMQFSAGSPWLNELLNGRVGVLGK